MIEQDTYRISGFEFTSRLFVGTGKYADFDQMSAALEASACEVVTVAVRRDVLDSDGRPKQGNIIEHLDPQRYTILPNTAGCFTAKDAVRSARLSRELLEGLGNPGAKWVKLEVLADKKTLLPDPIGTLEATTELVDLGFDVLVYTNDDPILCKRLKDAGATSVMPLGAPIGTGLGILNHNSIRLCIEYLKDGDADYPVIVDAGVGSASDVTIAMELGADGVLLNTGIAGARDPIRMAAAMNHAILAGRLAFQAGRIGKKRYASASSTFDGLISPHQPSVTV